MDIPPLKQTIDEVICEYEQGIILKMVSEDGTIIGSIRAKETDETVHIGKLMVHPDRRHREYGNRLLAEIEHCYPGKRYELFTSSRSKDNIRLYEKSGYREFERRVIEDNLTFVYMEKTRPEGRMSKIMKDYIAYCGLDCEKCEARLATVKNDNELRSKVSKEWSELNGVEISPEMINCTGCRMPGVKTVYCDSLCPIRQCAMQKQVETCGDCPEMRSCEKVGAIIGNNSEARDRLYGYGNP